MKTLIFTLLLLSTCQAQTQWHDSTITEEKLIKTCDTLENPLCNERGHVWKMYDAEEFINGISKSRAAKRGDYFAPNTVVDLETVSIERTAGSGAILRYRCLRCKREKTVTNTSFGYKIVWIKPCEGKP